MFTWYRSLYYSDRMKETQEHLKNRIEEGDFSGSCYLITLAYNGKDNLDIRPLHSLQHAYLQEKLPLIIGAAVSKKDACRLVEMIAQDCMREQGDANLRSYLEKQE